MPISGKELVLLVDDNHAHQYSLRKHLEKAGFDVAEASNGNDALTIANERRPDAILLDIHLPDILGFDVCRQLRSNATTSEIPIIFHSATYDTHGARSLAADLGAVSFLSYPIDIDHLISVLRGSLVRARNGQPK